LARALVALLRDERAQEVMGAQGLLRLRERFTAERMVQETLGVYRRVTEHAQVET
jgi:glycosyltransferase involved in cell wall biosynthesis